MKDKAIRLGKATSNELVKRVPYIIAVGLVIGIVAGVKSYHKTSEAAQAARDNSTKVAQQTAAIKQNTEAIKRNQAESNRKRDEQTLLLCQIILSGNLPIDDTRSQQIEKICKEAIRSANQESVRTSATTGQRVVRPSRSSPAASGSAPASSSKPSTSGQPSQPDNSQPVIPNQPLIVVPPLPQPCINISRLHIC